MAVILAMMREAVRLAGDVAFHAVDLGAEIVQLGAREAAPRISAIELLQPVDLGFEVRGALAGELVPSPSPEAVAV